MLKFFQVLITLPSNYPMVIEGLVYESILKVITLDGKVIRNVVSNGLQNDGQQLKWDGKDDRGNYVETGVYLLMIYNNNGESTIEKITVINES